MEISCPLLCHRKYLEANFIVASKMPGVIFCRRLLDVLISLPEDKRAAFAAEILDAEMTLNEWR